MLAIAHAQSGLLVFSIWQLLFEGRAERRKSRPHVRSSAHHAMISRIGNSTDAAVLRFPHDVGPCLKAAMC